jgi:hypothetical protein
VHSALTECFECFDCKRRFMANSATARYSSQSVWYGPSKCCRVSSKTPLACSVWPSIWGCLSVYLYTKRNPHPCMHGLSELALETNVPVRQNVLWHTMMFEHLGGGLMLKDFCRPFCCGLLCAMRHMYHFTFCTDHFRDPRTPLWRHGRVS